MQKLTLFIYLLLLLLLPGYSQISKHLEIASTYVGEKEIKKNSSPRIDKLLAYVGLKPPSPYCAAAVSAWIGWAGVDYPKIKTGLASNFITKKSIPASKVLVGLVKVPPGTIVIWRRGDTIFGHVGLVRSEWSGKDGETIEANTSSGIRGSQSDGDGIYNRKRSIAPDNPFRITHFTLVSYGSI